jgi:hypothetical protein
MIKRIFPVTGEKIASLLLDNRSFKFSSRKFNTVEEFEEAFHKTLSLAKTTEIKHSSVKSVRKPELSNNITIRHNTLMAGNVVFAFDNQSDQAFFFNYLEQGLSFRKRRETMSIFIASRKSILALLITIGATALGYYLAERAASGEELHFRGRRRGMLKLFNFVAEMLGQTGVIVAGTLIASFFIYKITRRFKNPQQQLVFVP